MLINRLVIIFLTLGTWETDVEKVEATGDKIEMSVVSLHPSTTYHFRVVAENGVGISKPSDPVTIITSEEGKNSIQNIMITNINIFYFLNSTKRKTNQHSC